MTTASTSPGKPAAGTPTEPPVSLQPESAATLSPTSFLLLGSSHAGRGHAEVEVRDNGKDEEKDEEEGSSNRENGNDSSASDGGRGDDNDGFRTNGQSGADAPIGKGVPENLAKDNNPEKTKGKPGRKRKLIEPDLGKKCGKPLRKFSWRCITRRVSPPGSFPSITHNSIN